MPRRVSQAASVSAGSEPIRSRIMFHAATLRAPSGGGPIARETEHCGQKQIRCAADFCRGLTPTVWANIYTAIDLCPASSSRLQRRQRRFSKSPFLKAGVGQNEILSPRLGRRKYAEVFPPKRSSGPRIDERNWDIVKVRRIARCQCGMLSEHDTSNHRISQVARAALLVPGCH